MAVHERYMTLDLFGASSGAFNAFDKDGDGIIKLNVLEVIQLLRKSRLWVSLIYQMLSYVSFCS